MIPLGVTAILCSGSISVWHCPLQASVCTALFHRMLTMYIHLYLHDRIKSTMSKKNTIINQITETKYDSED